MGEHSASEKGVLERKERSALRSRATVSIPQSQGGSVTLDRMYQPMRVWELELWHLPTLGPQLRGLVCHVEAPLLLSVPSNYSPSHPPPSSLFKPMGSTELDDESIGCERRRVVMEELLCIRMPGKRHVQTPRPLGSPPRPVGDGTQACGLGRA